MCLFSETKCYTALLSLFHVNVTNNIFYFFRFFVTMCSPYVEAATLNPDCGKDIATEIGPKILKISETCNVEPTENH